MLQTSTEELYAARMARYVCAMHKGVPDRVPLRPFAAEITARHAGFTCQEVTHDYRKAFEPSSAAATISTGTRPCRTWCTFGPA